MSTIPPSTQNPQSTADFKPKLIANRFEILEEIGHGGMGEVWLARDHQLGRKVALKVLRSHLAQSPDTVRRFENEARVTSQLQHPGIIPIHETGRFDNGLPFFVMKVVRGKTLRELLRTRKDLTDNRSRFLDAFLKICQTVAYAHSMKVLHRDLKPENNMVGAFGEVLVMDWGIAHVPSEQDVAAHQLSAAMPHTFIQTPNSGETKSGHVLGTCAYMSPEQANGEIDILGPWSDVFSLGAILCEILTGQPVYTGGAEQVFQQAAAGDIGRAFRRLNDCGADVELIALAQKCLNPDPARRFGHAGEVAAELEAFTIHVQERLRTAEVERARAEAHAEEESARKRLAEAKSVAERKRRRATLMLALAVLLLVIGTAAALMWNEWSSDKRRREVEARRADLARIVAQEIGKAEQAESQALSIRAETVEYAQAAVEAWRQGIAALDRAEAAGATGEMDANARQRLDKLRKEMAAALANARQKLERANMRGRIKDALEEARMQFALMRNTKRASGQLGEVYSKVFQAYGVDVRTASPQAAAARLGTFPAEIRTELALALDDWSLFDRNLANRLRAIAGALDFDPWRTRLRAAFASRDESELEQLALEAKETRQHPVALLLLGAVLHVEGNANGAILVLRAAQRQHPGDFWINLELGSQLCAAKDRESRPEGLIYVRIAVALRPASAVAYSNLGVEYFRLGQHEDAIRNLQKAIELDSTYVVAYHNLGSAHEAVGDHEAAKKTWKAGLALAPDHGDMHTCLGGLYRRQKQLDLAIKQYIDAIASDRGEPSYQTNLGRAYRDDAQWDKAIKCYEQAILIDAKHTAAHFLMGDVMELKGRPDEALRHYENALKIEPNSSETNAAIGSILYAQRKRQSAIEHLRKAVQFKPDYSKAHFFLGLCYLEEGEWDDMMRHYRLAVENTIGSDSPATNLAGCLVMLGDLEEAERYYRRAIRIDEDNPTAYFGLGEVLLYRGSFEESRTALARALLQAGKTGVSQIKSYLAAADRLIRLEPQFKKIGAGDFKPNDARDGCSVALLCLVKNHPAAAAQYYSAAFAKDPRAAQGSFIDHRLLAACSAAQAGTGLDAAKLPDAERVRWRNQARDWLRGLLTDQENRLTRTAIEERGSIRLKLAVWKRHLHLAGVRDAKSLEMLPEKERSDWKQLWDDVEALRKKTYQP